MLTKFTLSRPEEWVFKGGIITTFGSKVFNNINVLGLKILRWLNRWYVQYM